MPKPHYENRLHALEKWGAWWLLKWNYYPLKTDSTMGLLGSLTNKNHEASSEFYHSFLDP